MKTSIRRKLVLHVTFALLFSIVISTILNTFYSRHLVENNITLKYIPIVLRSISTEIERYLSTSIIQSQQLSNNVYAKKFISDGEKADDLKLFTNYLKESLTLTNVHTIFFVSEKTKIYYTYHGILKVIKDDGNQFDKWYFDFKNKHKDYDLNKDYDEATHDISLFINCAIKDGLGNFMGVGGFGIKLNELKKYLNNYKVANNGFIYLVDRQGLIQIHRDSTKEFTNIHTINGIKEHAKQILSKDSTNAIMISTEQGDKFVSSRYLPLLDWFIISEIPANEIYEEVNHFTLILISVNISIMLLLMLFLWWKVSKITAPIKNIHDEIDSIFSTSRWDLTRRVNVEQQDEIGAVATVFNQMMSKFQKMISNLSESKSQFSHQLDKISNMADHIVKISEDQENSTKITNYSIDKLTLNIKYLIEYSIIIRDINQSYIEISNEHYSLMEILTSKIQNIELYLNYPLSPLNIDHHYNDTASISETLFKLQQLLSEIQQDINLKNLKIRQNIKNIKINTSVLNSAHTQSLDHIYSESSTSLKELSNFAHLNKMQSEIIKEVSINIENILDMLNVNEKSTEDMIQSSQSLNHLIKSFDNYINQFKIK